MIGVRLDSGWDASSILQALLDCGFLVPAVGGYHVHQWLEYQGHIAAFSIRGKTAAKKRWAKLKEFSEKDATSIPDAMLDCIPSNAPTNPTNVSNPTNPTDDKRASKRFVKPTVEQISEYCLERENDLDAKYFYDSYEARGWKIGSSSMKDWKATVRTWEQRKNDFKPKGNQNGPNSHKHEKNSREFTERLTL